MFNECANASCQYLWSLLFFPMYHIADVIWKLFSLSFYKSSHKSTEIYFYVSYQSHNMMSYDLFKTRLCVPYATLVNELLDIEDKNSISWKNLPKAKQRKQTI